ncbi:MAG: winged helix-turn-helix domain-containing protein [Anaerolineales bacterium]
MSKQPANSKATPLPYPGLASKLMKDLASGRCAAVIGLSNTGKSTLMRGLAGEQAHELYRQASGRQGSLLYIDCNRAVATSPQAFYEVVLRSILERLEEELPAEVADGLRRHHQDVTEASQAFAASLSFNLALTELCEGLGRDLVLLIDEFDEIYAELEERALVNMRALRDRFGDQLTYVIATVRALADLRGRMVEGEFAEMFSQSTYRMPMMTEDESLALLTELDGVELGDEQRIAIVRLAGGHPGLLMAAAQAGAAMNPSLDDEAMIRRMLQAPQPGAECMKIWTQLSEEEQSLLGNLVLRPDARLPRPQMDRLERLGVLVEGELFCSIFAHFVMRRTRAPEVREAGIYIDEDSGDVWVDGVRIPVLTDLEFRLMELLDERRDKITDKYTIVTGVWGEEYLEDVDDARVEKLISRLRSKIEPEPSEPRYLITRRGRGYKLLTRPRAADSAD